jgi:aminocarboxymuconate-semialdehyde decarboxylase
MREEARQNLSRPPSASLRKFYFDTVTHSAAALRYLIDLVGAAQVMLGSDYPFDMGSERPAEVVEAVPDLSAAHTRAILGENAGALLRV